jgi:hypothetical protein
MTRAKTLRKLRRAFLKRLTRLDQKIAQVKALALPEQDPVLAYVAIESLNAWATFSRSYYLSCIIHAKTKRNIRIQVTPANMMLDQALGMAIQLFKPYSTPKSDGSWHRRDEPAWHDPNVLMRACNNVSCSQQNKIEAAFSLGQRVFLYLPVFRNFFAHRNQSSCRAAQSIAPRYSLPTSLAPTQLLLRSRPQAQVSIIVEWLDELKVTADFMC